MKSFIQNNTPFTWNKKGNIGLTPAAGFTHCSHPSIIHDHDDIFIFAFTSRDEKSKSHIFLAKVKVHKDKIEIITPPKKVLSPGKTGYFDMDGVITNCFVKLNGELFHYFCGWRNLPNGLWDLNTGMAKVDIESLSFEKMYDGPVLAANKLNGTCASATVFYHVGQELHTLYNVVHEWKIQSDGSYSPHYGLHHATSMDGIHWNYSSEMSIPFADEYEYAFGRPSVLFEDGIYYLWFACRATKHTSAYRMGFAYSEDGVHWNRNDKLAGIDVSATGWDSEMVCYPCVFKHNDKCYLLYNGNSYGKTGIGLAILEEE